MRKACISSLTFTLLIFLVSLSVSAEDFTGQVVKVIDGDTIEVMHLGKAERVRLHGVDCPEMGQSFGKRARQYTSTHTLRKTVTVIVDDTDKSGQTVGQVILPDMSNLNIVLISAGLAWWHETYAPEDKILMDVQKSAKDAKRGLWADPNPVPPWEWKGVSEKPAKESSP
jgi:endonuclease YncB( thermonuclease family)